MFCTKRWGKTQTQRGVPKFVAQFLNLENPDCYTGHAISHKFGRMTLKRHGGQRSSGVAEGYIAVESQVS